MSLFCSIILMGFRHDHSLPPIWDLSPKVNREVESDRRRHEPLKLRSTIIRGFLWIFGLLLLIAVIKGMETSPSLDRRIQNLDPFGVRGTADAQL